MKKIISVVVLLLCICGCSKDIVISEEEFRSYYTITELNKDNFFDYFEVIEEVNPVNDPETIDYYLSKIDVANEIQSSMTQIEASMELFFTYINGTYNMETNEVLKGYAYSDGSRHVDMKYTYRYGDGPKLFLSSEYETPYKDMNKMVQLRKTNTFDHLEVKEVSGKIETVKIPDSSWNTDKNNVRYIIIETADNKIKLYENGVVNKGKDDLVLADSYKKILLEDILS